MAIRKQKPRKVQDDRLLKHFPRKERRRQEELRRIIAADAILRNV